MGEVIDMESRRCSVCRRQLQRGQHIRAIRTPDGIRKVHAACFKSAASSASDASQISKLPEEPDTA